MHSKAAALRAGIIKAGRAKVEIISVCVTICSRERPVLLARALDCLSRLKVPEGVDLSFLVVENNDTPIYRPLISEMQKTMPLHYVQEPTLGLTYARNKALETVHALGVDWMGSVDDDQIIDPDWLVHMVAATKRYKNTAMFVGLWKRTNPPGTPSWYPIGKQDRNKRPTGSRQSDGVAGNALIRADVFSPKGMGLRYDHEYRFLGGEDTDFSFQYTAKGGIIRHVHEAVTSEDIPAERNDFSGRMERATWMESVLTKLRHKHTSPVTAILWSLQIVFRGSALGVFNYAVALLALPFSRHLALTRFGVGREFFAQVQGVLRYYFGGPLKEPYRETLGG